MDPQRFDAIARTLGSAVARRSALTALFASLVAPLIPALDAFAKPSKEKAKDRKKPGRKDKNRGDGQRGNERKQPVRDSAKAKGRNDGKGSGQPDKGNGKNRKKQWRRADAAQADTRVQAAKACFGSTACTPGPGKNLSTCDFGRTSTMKSAKCAGCNLGSTNFKEADASSVDLSRANLDKACLVDANLRGAILIGANVSGAVYCRTTMPDGSVNNRDCAKGTVCCPTCDAAHPCGSGQICCNGTCKAGNCCADAQCTDPAKPICTGNTCAPCTSNTQCGTGKRCCNGQCKSGVCCAASDCADRPCQSKNCTANQCAYTLLSGTPCDNGNPCTVNDVCQNGACAGTAKDCAGQGDACNDGVCRASDGACIKQRKPNGTACNADNDSCTVGDSCQSGVCTPGAGTNCSAQDDACNRGVCRKSDGACIKDPKPNGMPCGTNGTCQAGVCEEVTCSANGAACTNLSDCCNGDRTTCGPNGKCCVLDGAFCEGDDAECCAGFCRDNFCQGCLRLQQSCDPDSNQCCQNGGRANCAASFDFNDTNCCRPKGGLCGENKDCCDGRACTNGRCCVGEYFACASNADCCSGFDCRGGICRTNICLEPGENCGSGPTGCCPEGGATCSGGTCCQQVGSSCEQVPGVSDPCCGDATICAGRSGSTCCITDFSGLGSGPGECTSNDQCCSGYCHQPRNVCCRNEGASCTEIGALGFECCPYLGLTCSGRNGACIPCRKLGQTCATDGQGNSTCCIGSGCQGGVCVQSQCGTAGNPCQDSSTCCPGHFCNAEGGACIKSCEPEGEPCGFRSIFPCCGGLTCTGEPGSERCRR